MFDLEEITLHPEQGLLTPDLPHSLRFMILTMYYMKARRGEGFFCAYGGWSMQIEFKTHIDETEKLDKQVYCCDHIVPKNYSKKLNLNPHNLQALSWTMNNAKRRQILLHSKVKAAQLGETGLPDFREDFSELLFMFDQRVASNRHREALIEPWPFIWREKSFPHRPFIPAYDVKRGDFRSLEESVLIDEQIRANNLIAWSKASRKIEELEKVWAEYEKRFGVSPEAMLARKY